MILIKYQHGMYTTSFNGEIFESSNFKAVWLFAKGYGKDQAAELRYEVEYAKKNTRNH